MRPEAAGTRFWRALGTRHLRIRSRSTQEAYEEIEDFVETVTDPDTQDALFRALERKGAFRNFREAILQLPEGAPALVGAPEGAVRSPARGFSPGARSGRAGKPLRDRPVSSRTRIPKIAVLTGGGDAPGLNAVVRAVVKAALRRGWETFGVEDGFEGFFDRDGIRRLTRENVRGILQTGGSILRCSNRGDPFSFPEKQGDEYVRKDRSDEVVRKIDQLDLDALVVIGGDGSLGIAHRLSQKGIPVVGIPKTIDNDVAGTDVTFGFNTACQTAMEAIDRLHTTAASHERVMVIEVMGRDAGWIALKAGASGGGDVILIPEIPFDYDSITRKIAERSSEGTRFSLVVVSEGARPQDGEKIVLVKAENSPTGFERLGGVGDQVARTVEERLGIECRVTVLGHVQRGGSPTTRDRMLGTRFGVGAVDLVEAHQTGHMVGLRGEKIVPVPLPEVVGRSKRVDPEGQEVRAVEAIGVSFGR